MAAFGIEPGGWAVTPPMSSAALPPSDARAANALPEFDDSKRPTGVYPVSVAQIARGTVKNKTQKQYLRGVAHFYQWVTTTGRHPPRSIRGLDEALALFATAVFNCRAGRARTSVVHAVCGIVWLQPALRGRLPRVSAVLRGWARMRPSLKHPPLTWPLACWMALRLMGAGEIGAAVALLLSFDCLLRISEVTALRFSDVLLTSAVDSRIVGGSGVYLLLRDTKSGRVQSTSVDVPCVVGLLNAWIASRTVGRDDRLFGLTAQRLRTLFLLTAAGLRAAVRFTPHSARHGGATFLSMSGVPIEDVLARGRWASTMSARYYVQTGAAVSAAHGVSTAVVQDGERAAAQFAEVYGSS
jgi:integrase